MQLVQLIAYLLQKPQYYSVYQYANRTQDIDVDVDTSTNYISRVNEIKFTKLDNFPQDYTGFDSLSHLISNVNNTANIDYSDLSNFDNIFPPKLPFPIWPILICFILIPIVT